MLATAVTIASSLIVVALVLNLFRLLRGPGLPDRALALDTMYINSVALIVLYGIDSQSRLYFEAAMLIALIGSSVIWPMNPPR